MIRPLTIATFLLACGSGLYLYQSKHEVQLLDRTIERTVHDTGTLREQSRLLAAEWTMLNDPERLRQFSDTYLSLKTITPSQFSSFADLDNRLPAPQAEVLLHGKDERDLAPVPIETIPIFAPDAAAATVDGKLPVPPIPAAPPATAAIATVVRPADTKSPDRTPVSRMAVAESPARPVSATDLRLPDQRSSEQRVAPRVADARTDTRTMAAPPPRPIVSAPPPRPLPANVAANTASAPPSAQPAVVGTSPPYGGSLLGMAHSPTSPTPRPTPVNATYNSN